MGGVREGGEGRGRAQGREKGRDGDREERFWLLCVFNTPFPCPAFLAGGKGLGT